MVALAVLLCSTFVALDASAQFGGGRGGGEMRRGGGAGDRGNRDAASGSMQAVRPSLSDRLDQLAAQLLISHEQARAWDGFRGAFIALQRPGSGSASMSDSASALQAMQQKLSQAQDQFTLVESLAEALKQLEQQLDAQQRAVADRLLPPVFAEFVRMGNGRGRSPS